VNPDCSIRISPEETNVAKAFAVFTDSSSLTPDGLVWVRSGGRWGYESNSRCCYPKIADPGPVQGQSMRSLGPVPPSSE
jgi:hypothetical protein